MRKVWLAVFGQPVSRRGDFPARSLGGGPTLKKAREERLKVLLRARMLIGASWTEVCIVNITSRGLGLQAANPPRRGEYVEIRRGAHVIIGRVAWSGAHRFGIAAQGMMPVYSIINEPDRQVLDPEKVERRAAPRLPAQKIESRIRVRLFEFLFVAALARPMAQIATALGSPKPS